MRGILKPGYARSGLSRALAKICKPLIAIARPRRSRGGEFSGHEEWDEVRLINSYAVFMGHLAMGIKGLSILVFTWTTVVLLSGFVTNLGKKDFWCLTVITLVQTARVFDAFVITEKFMNILGALFAAMKFPGAKRVFMVLLFSFLGVTFNAWFSWLRARHELQIITALFVGLIVFGYFIKTIQIAVFGIMLFPVAVLYMYGLSISLGLSVWRLIERDYGVAGGEASKANLPPALDVLYSLALLQGLLFIYKMRQINFERAMYEKVAKEYGSDLLKEKVRRYLHETRAGCERRTSFARGRNLVTYAVDLLESRSADSYISGVRLLDALVGLQLQPSSMDLLRREVLLGHHMLMKQLLTGSNVIWRLVHTLDSRSPYERAIRGCAARIVAHLAGDVRLERLPGGIQCIASLLGTLEEYSSIQPFERDWLLETYEPDSLRGDAPLSRGTMNKGRGGEEEEEEEEEEEANGGCFKTWITNAVQEELACWNDARDRLVIMILKILSWIKKEAAAEADIRTSRIRANEEAGRQKDRSRRIKKMKKERDQEVCSADVGNLPMDYRNLVVQGMRILGKLAANEDNCKIIGSTRGLLSKIMVPVSSDLLHSSDHAEWPLSIVEGSLRVMSQLVTAPGETGINLRRAISRDEQAITVLQDILKCRECQANQYYIPAIKILAQLSLDDASSGLATESKEKFINTLLSRFVDAVGGDVHSQAHNVDDKDSSIHPEDKHVDAEGNSVHSLDHHANAKGNSVHSQDQRSSIREVAGEALAMLSDQSESNAAIIFKSVDALTNMLLDVESSKYRTSAAEILENLCRHYNKDGERLRKLKTMADAMPEVLAGILPCESPGGNAGFSTPDTDMESQPSGAVSQDNGQKYNERHKDMKLQAAVLSLCVTACDTLISEGQELVPAIDASSFARKLRRMVERNSDVSTGECLGILKLTTKMLISMVKHGGGRYAQQDLESLMEALSKASENMWHLDCSMVFASGNHGGTLASLVKEAKKLVDDKKAEELPAVPACSDVEGDTIE